MRSSASAIDANSVATDYAASLLASVGASSAASPCLPGCHPDLEWAASGAMALTGFADGPPLLAPGPLASAARGSVAALATLARGLPSLNASGIDALDGPALLGERAAIAGLGRRGSTSPGGTCHLVRCADGWIAVNLARSEDIELLPAWLGEDLSAASSGADLRDRVSRAVRTRSVESLVERAQLLGLPVAAAALSMKAVTSPLRTALHGPRTRVARASYPRVVDLSSLWAGPLATELLAMLGARVTKVESTRRPDGARRGPATFYDLVNGHKESVALDFSSPDGVHVLRKLIAGADIVVESSRPRALRQLGIDAERLVGEKRGLVWVSITGYGRSDPECNRVAFGDDAGVAAGLAMALVSRDGVPVFCGDALADPLAGLHAAAAALAWWQRGESVLLDVALRDVVAHAASFPASTRVGDVREIESGGDASAGSEWEVLVDGERSRVRPPRARQVVCTARELGADTARTLAEIDGAQC